MISLSGRGHGPERWACPRALSRLYTPSARRRRDPRGRVIDDRSFCPAFEPTTRGTTREQNHAAKRQIKELEVDLEEAMITNTNANLRLKIKRLCVKYHPDRGDTLLTSTEVARDLIALLSDF